jgi:hypothetical protein
MTVKELHSLTGKLLQQKRGDADVAIDLSTFSEAENANIIPVNKGKYRRIQGADDSGPTGPKFLFLVLSGLNTGNKETLLN